MHLFARLSRARLRPAIVAVAAVASMTGGVMFATPALASTQPVPSPLAAIRTASPESLAGAAQVPSALAAVTQNGVTTTLSADARKGITITSPSGLALGISLPFASSAGAAHEESSGIVSYRNTNGSSTVPILKADGSTQITTVIDGPNAPSRYSYQISLPDGVTASIDATGSVIFQNASGIVGIIAAPWAKDAKGDAVPTHYELSGDTLTQVINLNRPTIAYPVVADPSIWWNGWGYSVKYNKTETKQIASAPISGGLAVVCGFLYVWPPVLAACEAMNFLFVNTAESVARSASRDGRCVQVNYPAPFAYEVTC